MSTTTKAERIAPGEKVRVNSIEGVVVAFVPAGTDLRESEQCTAILTGRKVFNRMQSELDRYLVRLDRTRPGGLPIKPWFYAPPAGRVERENPKAKRVTT